MKIKAGDIAPDFKTEDICGNVIELSKIRNKRIHLAFLRNVDCIMCNLRVHQLIENKDKLESARLILFVQSPKEQILESMAKNDFPFTVIADPQKKIYKQYGVESTLVGYMRSMLQVGKMMKALSLGISMIIRQRGDGKLMPLDLLLEQDLTVFTAHYGKASGDHLPIEAIVSFATDTEALSIAS